MGHILLVDLLGFFRRCTQSGEASSETSWMSSCLWKHIHLKTDSKPAPRTSSSRERLPSLSRSKVLKAWKVGHKQVAPNATNTRFNRTSLMRFNWPASICVATKRAWNARRGAFTENKQGGLVKHFGLCSWKTPKKLRVFPEPNGITCWYMLWLVPNDMCAWNIRSVCHSSSSDSVRPRQERSLNFENTHLIIQKSTW